MPIETDDGATDGHVTEVIVISKTHMDVGFTDLASNVRERYLRQFFPTAIATAIELQESATVFATPAPVATQVEAAASTAGAVQRNAHGLPALVWTVGSWILDEALHDPEVGGLVEQAVRDGIIRWHAMPFTVHTEFCDRSVLESGLRISKRLDERFGVVTRAAKMTDVPGHTRGLVSLLASFGVDFLHVGLNPVAAPAQVPLQFRWRDLAAFAGGGIGCAKPPSVAVMYQPGSYGDVQIIEHGAANGGDLAISIVLTGDNLGPPSAEMIRETWADLQTRFPHAEVRAGSLEDVAEAMSTLSTLEVFEGEIGDTWIHGTASDPQKVGAYRELCRRRRQWIDEERVQATDVHLERATRALLLVGEHTWGLDQKTWWPNLESWTTSALESSDIARFEASWQEQREYLWNFVDCLRDCPDDRFADLSNESAQVLVDWGISRSGDQEEFLEHVSPFGGASFDFQVATTQSGRLDQAGWRIVVDSDVGGIASLVTPGGVELTDDSHPVAAFKSQLFGADHFEKWYNSYNSQRLPEDEWWARWDNTKPGLEDTDATTRWVHPQFIGCQQVQRSDKPALRLIYNYEHIDRELLQLGTFGSVIHIDVTPTSNVLDMSVTVHGRVGSRFPQADWWTFHPVVNNESDVAHGVNAGSGWAMFKFDEWIRPQSVVQGGSRFLHSAQRLRHDAGIDIELIDTPLVSVGEPRILTWDNADFKNDNETPTALKQAGWSLCLYNNLWGTNFPMWNSGTLHSRVRITTNY